VYDTTLGCFYYYNSSAWISLCQAGPQGPAGADGPTGAQGPQGVVGATGPQGTNGADGATGPQGPAGATGPQGVAGVTGPQGDTGLQGVPGANGATGVQGVTGPQGPQGVVGATGPQGAQGAQGIQGIAGVTGATGLQGAVGATGPQGAQGAQGIQGVAGVTGATGSQGAQGIQGVAGVSGAQGIQGVQGTQGVQGLVGATGATGPSWVNYQVNQTAAITANSTTFQIIPGLTKTITLTSPAKLLVFTDGGIQTTSASTAGYSLCDVVVNINGNWCADGGFKRLNAINSTGITGAFAFWSMGVYATTSSGNYTLPAGTYTIDVRANLQLGSNATIGGNNTTVLQGVMQVFIVQ